MVRTKGLAMNQHVWWCGYIFQSIGGFFTFITVIVNGYIAYQTKRRTEEIKHNTRNKDED
jgi:hypothetical protein